MKRRVEVTITNTTMKSYKLNGKTVGILGQERQNTDSETTLSLRFTVTKGRN